MLRRTIILAAGGTGGHVFPAQALAESLIFRGWTVLLVTDQRGDVFAKSFPIQVQKLVLNITNPSGDAKFSFIRSMWLFIKSLITVFRFFLKTRPNIIVGFGGYPSATSMVIATILRIPSVIHEQNAVLGRINRLFQNQAKLLVFGIKPKAFRVRKGRTLVLGNPIRQSILSIPPVEYSTLSSKSFLILVVGGSQGAQFVSAIACDAILDLPQELRKKIRVMHQCRPEDVFTIKSKYEASKIQSETKSFFTNISSSLNEANLIISRSGASSLAEFCIFGRPSILIPLPSAVGNHQALNAAIMEESGASVVLNQNCVTSHQLSRKICYILENFKVANKMAISAKKQSQPDAAFNFAIELETLI